MDVTNVTADAETFTCNAYLVEGDRTVLIDAGAWPGIIDAVGARTDALDAIVLTHQHSDHVEMLDSILDAFDAPVYAHADHPQREGTLDDGDQVFIGDDPFDVVYTPGHADDHVSLVSETTLFSGDVVVHDDGAFDHGSFGRTDLAGQSRERLIESIETLLEHVDADIEHMYAGHGGVFHGDVLDVVEIALERAKKREPKYPDEA